jgi:hypothetical protein
VCYKGKLTRQADLLTRHPARGIVVSAVSAFISDVRGGVILHPCAGIKQGVSIGGDSLFSDMQKEVMND